MHGIEMHYRLQNIIENILAEHTKLAVLEDSMRNAEQISRMRRIDGFLTAAVRELECVSTSGDLKALMRQSILDYKAKKSATVTNIEDLRSNKERHDDE